MADHGIAELVTVTPLTADAYGIAPGLAYGTGTLMTVAPLEATAYALGGTTPCPPSGPTVPTTGQIWPRGNW